MDNDAIDNICTYNRHLDRLITYDNLIICLITYDRLIEGWTLSYWIDHEWFSIFAGIHDATG